ncbi:hypothetical protein FJ251_03925 [bacterium]|nr:hypothetical protein [bacterium]
MRSIHLGFAAALALGAGAVGARAADFTPLAFPGAGERTLLDRRASRADLDRELFGGTAAGLIVGRVDVYERFPYLEARYLQVVSDPVWNRLLYGDPATGLAAYTGEGSALGALAAPRGLAADDAGQVYVADSGNDRVLVLAARYDSEALSLTPLYVIVDLKAPGDLAWSDGGTPFDARDDRLFVAETGANRVASLAITQGQFAVRARLGALGGGNGRFAGPVAVAATWDAARAAHRILVADAHGGRLVELSETASGLRWERERAHGLGVVTGLEFDAAGNLYAAAPRAGVLRKFSPSLAPQGDLEAALNAPRDFCVPAVTVHDHRTGEQTRRREAAGLLVEAWSEGSGLRLYSLADEQGAPGAGAAPASLALLGNHPNPFNPSTTLRFSAPVGEAPLRLSIHDLQGRLLRVLAEGQFAAGEHAVVWDGRDAHGEALPSGVYFSRLSQGRRLEQGKLLLLK